MNAALQHIHAGPLHVELGLQIRRELRLLLRTFLALHERGVALREISLQHA